MIGMGSDLSSFGTVLKAFRKRRGLTQQQLAQAIGTHRTAIIRWEQGDFLPESKTMVLELAKQLHLDNQESRLLLEASLTALSPYWYVPFPRNPFFTGREEILDVLHAQLDVHRAIALTQSSALSGLGGVGKTQIALEYAYRHALEYTAIFWVGAETEEQVVASLLRIAEVLQLPGNNDKSQQRTVKAVQRWLSTHQQWLLIWDNVEDLDLLERFLPANRQGTLLLTTRYQALGTLAQGLDLLPMEPQEGMRLLLRRAKVLGNEATWEQVQCFAQEQPLLYAAATELVEILAGLPLALDQAGAYLEETRCGLLAYRDLFHTRRAVLLQQRGEGSRHHPASVFTTFTLAIAAATRDHPAVGNLLRVCALLQPDAIPEEIFRLGGEHLGGVLQSVCHDPLEWNRVMAIASSYSLLHRQPEEQTVSLHRLVQAVLLDSLTDEERRQWVLRTIAALDAVFPEVRATAQYSAWKQGGRLLPHALLCLHYLESEDQTLVGASVAGKAGQYQLKRGRYEEAEPLLQRALHIREQTLGPMHPHVASTLNDLADLSGRQGKYDEAETFLQQALDIREQVLGPMHPHVASTLNTLANLSKDRGRYDEAECLYQRALDIREQVLGPMHPDRAPALNNLANLYVCQGKYAAAEMLLQQVIHIREQAGDPEHPYGTHSLHTLAYLRAEQGQYEEAERLFLRVLHIWEQTLGPEHPDIPFALINLAELSREQGRYEAAEALLQRALQIQELALGSDHPDIAHTLNTLAELSREQGSYKDAERHFLRVLNIREQALGSDHPDIAYVLNGLANLWREQGRYADAEALLQRALAIYEQALGSDHPKAIFTLQGLANLWREQGRYTDAEALLRRTLSIQEQHAGPQHPETATILYDLALLQQQQGKRDEARSLVKRALQILSQAPGETHPQTIAARTLYTQLFQEQAENPPDRTAQRVEARMAALDEHCSQEISARALPQTFAPSHPQYDALPAFLAACCELHPHARCRAADLWQAYAHWAEQNERFPLSRRALTKQLQVLGCQAGRTNTARIWRGIALTAQTGHRDVTECDRI